MVLEYEQFSVKSYVFSFGKLLLEIISGKKNKGSYDLNHRLNLIGNSSKTALLQPKEPSFPVDKKSLRTNSSSSLNHLQPMHLATQC
ncbi:hypothetical protein SLEP1_g58170 [Rubroshorea leprosula]|uniref:Uncharacterized protein n=1 Tax=Rubroshorea leprosula TaxID=152421 RepID=A0AAV5MPP9_9ROSI|nr:hypothetical protein SLEP1_g58170 [Rubroshorea leprosula]